MPAIAALAYHRASGRAAAQPNQRLSYAENFLYMLDAGATPRCAALVRRPRAEARTASASRVAARTASCDAVAQERVCAAREQALQMASFQSRCVCEGRSGRGAACAAS